MSALATGVLTSGKPRRIRGGAFLPSSLGLAVMLAAATAGSSPAGGPGPKHRGSIKDEPGYVETVDPESMSVALGRRLNAPAVSARFTGGGRSLDDLGRRLCRALDVNRADSLRALCVTDAEFRDILWREFPQSRPATGLTWVDAWRILFARLNGGSIGAVNDYGGHPYEFQRFERETTAVYRNFRLHNRLTMVVKDEAGEIQRWNWVRSVAERKGMFKVYSLRD
jgi:hypothetical protein